jgi:hypothetical protein
MPDLPTLAKFLEGCPRCKLSKTRTNLVFGQGNPKAELMFVGEAPGRDEDEQGLAFVGKAGQLLTKIIEAMGKKRDGRLHRECLEIRRRYTGSVMSIDGSGQIVPRRVTGWHATPLAGRRVFRLSYRSARRAGAGRVGIELTGDHPVLTEDGYVRVDRLRPGARIATGQGLSPLARDVVWGTLLGDGHLNARSAHLTLSHSASQAEYALFKTALLEELVPVAHGLRVSAVSGGAKTYSIVQIRSLASRALGLLRAEFYAPRKRVPPSLVGQLNDRMLAVWFMDDGYTRIRPPRQPLSEIATCAFNDEDRRILIGELERLGLPAWSIDGRLFFDAATSRRLSERIARYVPPVMRYKLHPEVAADRSYDLSGLRPELPEVAYAEADVEDVTDRPRTDATFYCIDVEETHNFVTSGGRSQLPPSQQSQPGAGGGRDVPAIPVRADPPHRSEGDRDAGDLRGAGGARDRRTDRSATRTVAHGAGRQGYADVPPRVPPALARA